MYVHPRPNEYTNSCPRDIRPDTKIIVYADPSLIALGDVLMQDDSLIVFEPHRLLSGSYYPADR